MTSKKHKFGSKVFISTILMMVVFSWLISPFTVVCATTATTSGTSEVFSGYSSGMTDDAVHLATRLTAPSDDAPSLTILVHGQSGDMVVGKRQLKTIPN